MGPEVPAHLLSFLHSSESSVKYIFALDVMSRLLIVLNGRNREEYVHSIFPEVQVLVCFVLFLLWLLMGTVHQRETAGAKSSSR